jgi:hypothetical protein
MSEPRYVEVTVIQPPYEGPVTLMPFAFTPDGQEPDACLMLTPEDAAKVAELIAAGNGCVRVWRAKDGKSFRFSLAQPTQ